MKPDLDDRYFPGIAAQIKSYVVAAKFLNGHDSFRYELANGRKIDYWNSTGTFMEVGTDHSYRNQRDRLVKFVRTAAHQPSNDKQIIGKASGLTNEQLIEALCKAFPLLPGLAARGQYERGLVHEACARLACSTTDEWPELLLTEVYHPESDYIYT